jgi:hypothetical protein
MQNRHPPIGNEPDKYLAQVAQIGSLLFSQVQTISEGLRCKRFEFGNVHRNFSLGIPHADARGFCASTHLTIPVLFAGTESEPSDSVAGYSNRTNAPLIPPTSGRHTPSSARRNNDTPRHLQIRFRECDGVCCSQFSRSQSTQPAAAKYVKPCGPAQVTVLPMKPSLRRLKYKRSLKSGAPRIRSTDLTPPRRERMHVFQEVERVTPTRYVAPDCLGFGTSQCTCRFSCFPAFLIEVSNY